MLAVALILQAYTGVSDDKVIEATLAVTQTSHSPPQSAFLAFFHSSLSLRVTVTPASPSIAHN